MTIDEPRCPPAPTAAAPQPLIIKPWSAKDGPLIRIFWDKNDPLVFLKSDDKNRFDPLPDPWADTKAWYAGTSLETSAAETVLRWNQIKAGAPVTISQSARLDPRRVAFVEPTRQLGLIDATGLSLGRIEDAIPSGAAGTARRSAHDIFYCNDNDYPETRRWGAWFRTQSRVADGVMWVSRQFDVGKCVVLFEDRCGGELRLSSDPVPLYAPGSQERATIDRMLDVLQWGIDP